MANSLRTLALLMLLAFSQCALGGFVRQTTSNRLLENKIPVPLFSNDVYVPQFVLMPDEAVVLENTPQTIDVLNNDQFSGFQLDLTTFTILHDSALNTQGYAEVIQGNEIRYTPAPNFSGWDLFSYSLCDHGTSTTAVQCGVAQVRVFVAPQIAGPTAHDDEATLSNAPQSIIIDVLANDEDSDGPFANWESLRILAQPKFGVATVTKDYKIEYQPVWQPNQRFSGLDIGLVYEICDDVDGRPELCSQAHVSVQVDQVCVACETCSDISDKDYMDGIVKVFRKEVYPL